MKRSTLLVALIYAFILTFTVSAASLVARYEFENNVNDTTGTYNGTAYNGPSYTAGVVGSYSISLDGVDDHVQITRPVAGDFTIAFWVKTTQTGGTGQWWAGAGLVDGDTSSSSRDFGTSLVGSKFAFGIGGTDTTVTSITSINNGQWYHVTAVRTQSTGSFSVYVNGVLENTATGSTSLLNRSTYLRIGGILTGTSGSFFSGNIDDIRLYDYVLSASDIATLAGTDAVAPTPNPAAWASQPHAISSSSIIMTATTGSDASGTVQYYFEETSGNPGGHSSDWIDSPIYTDYDLKPLTTYTYKVRMKDKYNNVTSDSAAVSATTAPTADINSDKSVNLADLKEMAVAWLETNCQNSVWCDGTDLDIDGNVEMPDFMVMADNWLNIYDFHTWASNPPMGWNSYDCYGYGVNEAQVKTNADYMAQNLKSYGWEYIVVDFCWYVPDVGAQYDHPEQNSSFSPHSHLDEYGRLLPDEGRFPSSVNGAGFKPLADYVHSLGLKFGIHLMRGIPREVVAANLPVKGTPYTASQAANTSSTCPWYNLMYGLNMSHPAGQAYLNSLFELYAAWDVDFVKIDDLSASTQSPYYHSSEVEGYRTAIDQCGRNITMSTSPGPTPLAQAAHISANANMWRVLNDLWDNWNAENLAFDKAVLWQNYIGAGHWPDLDMLPIGKLSKYGPVGSQRYSALTENECYTMMSLWCIARSPLIFGGNLPENRVFETALLTNAEVIAINQNSMNNRVIINNNYPIWAADIPNSGDKYIAFFNRTSSSASVSATLSWLGIKRCQVRDLWMHTDLGEFANSLNINVNAHGVKLFKLTVLETTAVTSPSGTFTLKNSNFDYQTINDGSWSGATDITNWNDDAGGDSYVQNLTTAQIDPASQSGENTGVIGQQAWIGQNLTYDIGTPVIIEANKTYQITVWIGRRFGTEGSAAGILNVYLEDADSNTQITGTTYDLLNLAQGAWTQQTFTLSTGTNPTGLGNALRLGFENIGTRGTEQWHGQIVIDSVTFTDVTP
jgi:alpha-galactosidase